MMKSLHLLIIVFVAVSTIIGFSVSEFIEPTTESNVSIENLDSGAKKISVNLKDGVIGKQSNG